MATFKSSDWKEVKFNGQDVTEIILNGTSVWKKVPRQSKRVSATTQSFGMIGPTGVTIYPASGSVNIGLNCKDVTIDKGLYGNSVSYNSSTGVAKFTIYGIRANTKVIAFIYWYQ